MGCLDLSSLPVPGFPGTGSGEPPPPPYVSQVCYLDAGAANQAANQAANDLEWSRVRPAGGAVFNVGFFRNSSPASVCCASQSPEWALTDVVISSVAFTGTTTRLWLAVWLPLHPSP